MCVCVCSLTSSGRCFPSSAKLNVFVLDCAHTALCFLVSSPASCPSSTELSTPFWSFQRTRIKQLHRYVIDPLVGILCASPLHYSCDQARLVVQLCVNNVCSTLLHLRHTPCCSGQVVHVLGCIRHLYLFLY